MEINILININISILEITDKKKQNSGNKYINQHKNRYILEIAGKKTKQWQ